MTNAAVANFLSELNAAGVEQLVIGKDGVHVTCLVQFTTAANAVLPHFHIRCLPGALAGLISTTVNQAATVAQPLTTDGT